MSFASLPLWGVLGLLGATAVLVVLTYLLRRTPRPQAVSNIAFWMEAMQRARPRFLSSSRIPLLSLLVSLIIALLIAAEIGGPRFGEGVRGTTVIVLDAGSSMDAEDGTQTRFERALDETRRWVERSTSAGETPTSSMVISAMTSSTATWARISCSAVKARTRSMVARERTF